MNINDEKTEPLIVAGPRQRKKTRKFKLGLVVVGILLMGMIAIFASMYFLHQKADAIICESLWGGADNRLDIIPDNSKNAEWIYYIDDQGDLSKIKKDGTSQKKLLDGGCDAFCITEPWIYYAKGVSGFSEDNNMTIGKIRIDGNENTELSRLTINSEQDDMAQIKVSDDYIYYAFGKNDLYSETMPNFGIYKLKTDGSDSLKILGDEVNKIVAIEDGWIYFSEPSTVSESACDLYRMNLDGKEKIALATVSYCTHRIGECEPIINGDWIYYINSAENDSLFKMRKDGTEKQKIHDGSLISMFEQNESLYFVHRSNSGMDGDIVKIQMDGGETETLDKDAYFILGVDDKWIYYIEQGNDFRKFLKVGLDGKAKQRIWMFGTVY